MGRRWEALKQCGLIAIVAILSLSVWFSMSAVFPALRVAWDIGPVAAAWLLSIVQIGFVIGALISATTGLPDRVSPQKVLAFCSALAGVSTAIVPILDSYWAAMVLRFVTGVSLAGVYPVGMQLTASWSPPQQRGRALGVMLAAIVVGSSLPHLVQAYGYLPWKSGVWVSAALALTAAGICAVWIRRGPYALKLTVRPKGFAILEGLRVRRARLVNLGYFGHMWELYAWWAWLPSFYLAIRKEAMTLQSVSLIIFIVLGIAGGAGCIIGGWIADRIGRTRAAGLSLAVSGGCCLLSPLVFSAPSAVVLTFMGIWGAAIVADSGMFSAALSESVDSRMVGTALTVQTAIGFLITNVSMIGVPVMANWFGWQFAFLLLIPGPAIGIWAMTQLKLLDSAWPDTTSFTET